MAASDAAKEAIWLQDMLQELKLKDNKPTKIYQDNQGAIFLEKNNTNKARTKHIDVRYHFIREKVQAGRITIHYCPTEQMMADILTKPLNETAYIKHRNTILNEECRAPNGTQMEPAAGHNTKSETTRDDSGLLGEAEC